MVGHHKAAGPILTAVVTAEAAETKVIIALDHIQLAMPAGSQDRIRGFYCDLLGMVEQPKPDVLQARDGFWASAGTLAVHFGIAPDFHPATKAHPAFIVDDIDGLFTRLTAQGHAPKWDQALPEIRRFFVNDPVGNRLEIMDND